VAYDHLQSVLTGLSILFQKSGFKLVEQEANHSFGHDLVSETWELDLG
jgi:hypothetical protein